VVVTGFDGSDSATYHDRRTDSGDDRVTGREVAGVVGGTLQGGAAGERESEREARETGQGSGHRVLRHVASALQSVEKPLKC
jgi:hypothetical protein